MRKFFKDDPAIFKDSKFPLAVLRMRKAVKAKLHAHDFTELVVVEKGKGIHITEQNKYQIISGDVFVIPEGMAHGYENTDNLQYINILYSLKNLKIRLADLPTLPGYHALFALEPDSRDRDAFKNRLFLTPTQLRQVKFFIDKLEEELNRHIPGYKFVSTGQFMQLIGYFSRIYSEAVFPVKNQPLKMGKVLAYIEKNFQQVITQEKLAQAGNMSGSTLQRVFKKTLGISPITYLNHFRIQKAILLLKDDQYNITEIARASGFEDSNYFSRIFKKIAGMTPTEFQKNL